MIIKPKRITLPIHRDRKFRESELQIIKWLINKDLLSYIYLKKPVNNVEIGFIRKINLKPQNIENYHKKTENNDKETLVLKNIFGKEIKIPYNKIELIIFEYTSAMIQIKSETSFSSRLGYKILKKFKPERILIT
ncbi:hypothetical protein ES703_114967 [subsurface metagenome]